MAGANQVLEANLQGGQYVVLGSAVPYMTTSIFVVPTVQRPEDLRGLAVGVSNFGATTHVALKVAFEHWGFEEGRDVTVVRSGGTPETIAAMQSGAIAGGSFGAPQSFLAHDLGFRELIDVARAHIAAGIVQRRERLASVERFRDRQARHEDCLVVARIDPELTEIHRPRVAVARVRPRLAAILGTKDAATRDVERRWRPPWRWLRGSRFAAPAPHGGFG